MGGHLRGTRRVAYELRPARASDRDVLYRIKRDALAPYAVATWGPWNDDAQRARFDASFDVQRFQIVLIDGEPIGLLETYLEDDHLRLRNIALVAAWRNHGMGTALVRALTRTTRREIRLTVLAVNPARRFYQRLGFEVVGPTNGDVVMMHLPAR